MYTNKFLAPNQDNFPLIEVIPGLWLVDLSNAKYLGFWDKYEEGDEYYLKQGKTNDMN